MAASRLQERYETVLRPMLMKEFGYKNLMQVPRLEKIVVNMGVGEAVQDAKKIDAAVNDLMAITGQRPIVTRARARSRRSNCARACRSVARSRCAASACTNFS